MPPAKKPNPREIIVPEIVVAAGSGKSLRVKRRENAWHETEKIERQAGDARRRADEAKQKAKELAAEARVLEKQAQRSRTKSNKIKSDMPWD